MVLQNDANGFGHDARFLKGRVSLRGRELVGARN